MSLETLLEAAKYIEYRSQVKARGEEPFDYYTFSTLSSSVNSSASSTPTQDFQQRYQSSQKGFHHADDTRERKRTGSSTSRDSQEHGGTGTREVHNKLEKNRRAHLKECFDALKKELPNMDERKTSNLSILRGAIRFIQSLKRKGREHEHDLESLARDKIAYQQQLAVLKKELSTQFEHIDVNALMLVEDNETTTTASECGAASDLDDHEDPVVVNHNSSFPSEETGSLSSTNSIRIIHKSRAPAPTAAGGHMKNNSTPPSDAKLGEAAKVLPHPSALDPQLYQVMPKEECNNHLEKNIHGSCLQSPTEIPAAPHSVQVISPPSNLKLLTSQRPISSIQSGNQIHVASNASYIPSPVNAATLKTVTACKKQPISPITLLSTQEFIEINQTAGNSKPVIIKQASDFSELMGAGATSLATTQVMMKSALPSSVFGPNVATLAVKHPRKNGADIPAGVKVNVNSGVHLMAGQQLIHPNQNIGLYPTDGAAINNIQQITTSVPYSSSVCSPLTSSPGLTHFLPQHSRPVNNVSTQIGSVSVVSHTGAVQQVLSQATSVSNGVGSSVVKGMKHGNHIPIIPQFIQAAGVASHHNIAKSVVVVSMPNAMASNLTQRQVISTGNQIRNSKIPTPK